MPELEIVLTTIVLILLCGVILTSFKSHKKPLSQRNTGHIEWLPTGIPVLKRRVPVDSISIKLCPIQPGYLSYAGMSRVNIKKKEV
jgi:hypothetical protein